MRKVFLSVVALSLLFSMPAMAKTPTAQERRATCQAECSQNADQATCIKNCLAKLDKEYGKVKKTTKKKSKKSKKTTQTTNQ